MTTNGENTPTPANGNGNGNNNAAVDEEDDPIVHEIPVFLAKTLANQLYVFQYPVRPAHMSYDTSTVLNSRIRPNGGRVELSIALDSESTNFDASKAEQIALNVDGSGDRKKAVPAAAPLDPDDKEFPSGIMDKQTLISTTAVENTKRYAVGILGGNELHITPVKGVLNLRPGMSYLDKSDKTARAEGRPGLAGELDPDDPIAAAEDAAAEAKPVTVRFAKNDQDAYKKQREKSYDYQQKKAEEEPWIPTRFNQLKSERFEEEAQLLFCKKMDEEITSLNQAPTEYLKALTDVQATS